MTSEERELMTATIEASVAKAVAPLSDRLTVLETQSKGATWLVSSAAGAIIAALVAYVTTRMSAHP